MGVNFVVGVKYTIFCQTKGLRLYFDLYVPDFLNSTFLKLLQCVPEEKKPLVTLIVVHPVTTFSNTNSGTPCTFPGQKTKLKVWALTLLCTPPGRGTPTPGSAQEYDFRTTRQAEQSEAGRGAFLFFG